MEHPIRDVIRAAREAEETRVAALIDATVATPATPETAAAAAAEAEKGAVAFKGISVSDDGVIVGIGGSVNLDSDDDTVTQNALIGMAYDFCSAGSRTFKGNHQHDLGADLVASWPGAPILQSGKTLAKGEALPDPTVDPVIGINITKGQETHWFVQVRPHDPAIADEARKGGVTFSWSGHVKREG